MFFFPLTPKGRASRKAAKKLYAQIVARAREPVFYAKFYAPDSFTGRFEMISLHIGMVINRIRGEGAEGQRLAQSLFDEMFLKMDMSCRQQGVGDLGVPKHIKRMMTGLQGRALTYETASKQGIPELAGALNKNLYATIETPPQDISLAMAKYVLACNEVLNNQSLDGFKNGKVYFAPLPQNNGDINVEISQVA